MSILLTLTMLFMLWPGVAYGETLQPATNLSASDPDKIMTAVAEPATTQLATPTGLTWDDTTSGAIKAKWSSVENADKYKVYLYKGGHSGWFLSKLEPTTERDFRVNLENAGTGTYTFKVEAIPAVDSAYTTSALSEASDPYNFTAPACSIGTTKYTTLAAALGAVPNDGTATIKLLQNIDHNGGINLGSGVNKEITFDLNGFTLNVVNTAGAGVATSTGSTIDYIDTTDSPGKFNVIGKEWGVWAWYDTSVKVSNATATASSSNNDAHSYGAYARHGAQITVTENAIGNKYGAYADSASDGKRSKVVVGGDAKAESVYNSGNQRIGAIATNSADVEVEGNASGGYHGVYAKSNSTAKVGGNATGGMWGAYAGGNSTTEVTGDAVSTEDYGAAAYNYNEDSSVVVKGDAIANLTNGIGATANRGNITIDGMIEAQTYVRIGSTDLNSDNYTIDPAKSDYRKYSDSIGTGIVWVKNTAAEKADGPEAPAAPTLADKTHKSVTLTASPAHQFSKDNGLTWQDSNVFTGLSAATEYTFVARVKETATHKPSGASTGLIVTTNKAPSNGSSSGGGGGSCFCQSKNAPYNKRKVPHIK